MQLLALPCLLFGIECDADGSVLQPIRCLVGVVNEFLKEQLLRHRLSRKSMTGEQLKCWGVQLNCWRQGSGEPQSSR